MLSYGNYKPKKEQLINFFDFFFFLLRSVFAQEGRRIYLMINSYLYYAVLRFYLAGKKFNQVLHDVVDILNGRSN